MVVEEVFHELFEERENRIRDAIELKEPDRVPVICHGIAWYFRMVPDVTARDMVENNDKFMKVLLKFMLDI